MSSYGKYLDSGPTFWASKTTIQVEHHRVKTFRIPFFLHHTATCMRKADEEKQAWRFQVFGRFFLFKGLFVP